MKNKKISMKVIHPNCAGIDVGSRSHFVAIGQDLKDVKEFGVYAQDLKEMAKWLHENGISTVAMESTGQYWQNLFVELLNSQEKTILSARPMPEKQEEQTACGRPCTIFVPYE